MARLAISKDYFPAYARLPRKAQRKADEFLRKFEHDSTAAAIHLEPIKRTLDAQLRSARIGDDYRVILRAPERGDVFLVLWADHHDEAYRWAVTKQTAVHPSTGSLQIFDVADATEAITTAPEAPAWQDREATKPRAVAPVEREATDLFKQYADDDLFIAGVPRALLPSVRAIYNDGDLDRLLPHLPPEAGEVLTALAAGIPLDEALEEVLGRVAVAIAAGKPIAIDTTDVPAALARDTTQRQFRLLEDGLDLDTALKHPLDVWRLFLHPRQRAMARARSRGPTRVLGGAGTGKTVVALHRAAFLVRDVFTKPDDRVLLTTFTVNLSHDLKNQLAKLLEPDELARVDVVNIDAWASRFLRSRSVVLRPAFEKEQRHQFTAAYEAHGRPDVPLDFYRMEWREIVQAQELHTEDEYLGAPRRTRGGQLSRNERRQLWPVFAAYRDNLDRAGLTEPLDILRRAKAEIEKMARAPLYRSVVVDETQDFAADGLRLLRAIAGPERENDLFLVGDAHQRIYGRPMSLSHCGIDIRGRSKTLRINYRTTGAICRWSMAVLSADKVDDLDGGEADDRGYVSLREGALPNIHPCRSPAEEEGEVIATIKACIAAGAPAEAICIVARRRSQLNDRFAPALQRAGLAWVVLEQDEPRLPGVRLATMHRVKGLEFAIVLLVGITKRDMPHPTPELASDDPLTSAQALLRERSLLYVAASRARDAMHVFYSGEPSPLLAAVPVAASALLPPSNVPHRASCAHEGTRFGPCRALSRSLSHRRRRPRSISPSSWERRCSSSTSPPGS